MPKRPLYAKILVLSLALTACATNPVTGEKELQFISQEEEIAQGQQLFPTTVQMEGGPYQADPALQAYVEEVGQKLVKVSDRQLPYEFIILENLIPNAWTLPGGKIAVNAGLLAALNSEAELAAVLSHEIVHAAARHGAQQSELNSLSNLGLSTLGIASNILGLGLAGSLAQNAAGVGSQLINQSYSRADESEADYYGMKYMAKAGYAPQAAVELQKTFLKLSEQQNTSWLSTFFASHPPSAERLIANEKTAAQLPSGEWYKERYQQKVAALKKSLPAYQKSNEGWEALKNNEPKTALSLAEQALAIQPQEAKFYSLQGLALLKLGHNQQALDAFNQAVEKNPYFFVYYLERGLLYKALDDKAKAKRDLEASLKLLPTKTAHEAYQALN